MRLKFTAKERRLIQGLILDESGVAKSLENATARNGGFEVLCSPDSLEHLLDGVAAEANHVRSAKRRKESDALYDRLAQIQEGRDMKGSRDR